MKNFEEFVRANKQIIFEHAKKIPFAIKTVTPSFHAMIRGFTRTNGTNITGSRLPVTEIQHQEVWFAEFF